MTDATPSAMYFPRGTGADETVGKTGHIKAARVRAGIGRCKVGIFNQEAEDQG